MAHVIRVMNGHGHTEVTWDPEVKETVEAAEQVIKDAQRKGSVVFTMDPVTKMHTKHDAGRRFDPTTEVYLVVPQMMGG